MINRTLVRVKVVQLAYSAMIQTDKSLDVLDKELVFSINKARELGKSLLMLMVESVDYQRSRLQTAKEKKLPTYENLNPNTKFVDNLFIAQLEESEQIIDFRKHVTTVWNANEEYVKRFTNRLLTSDLYFSYMENQERSYQLDKQFWNDVFKKIILEDDDLMEVLEESSLYWNDDIFVVQSFMQKFFNQCTEENVAGPLLDKYHSEEDIDFGKKLLHHTVIEREDYKAQIEKSIINWELDRIAMIDMVVMCCAIAEIKSFPSIPVKVTLNEYIEIVKMYSTPRSGKFVNGVLDKLVSVLRQEGELKNKL